MRTAPNLRLAIACVASGLIAAACAASAPNAASPVSELTGTAWVVQAVDGAPVAGPAPHLAFGAEDRLSGSGGCNRLSAIYEADNGAIDVRSIGFTKMACETPIMRVENAFLGLLAEASRYERDGERLVITAEDGRSLVLAPAA
jgi:heat shock protein HslJ